MKIKTKTRKPQILLDQKKYVIGGNDGMARVFLTIDFHRRSASVQIPFYNDQRTDLRYDFVFKNTSPRNIQAIGSLLKIAGEVAEAELKKEKDKEPKK